MPGGELSVLTEGPERGEPVVFLHGVPESAELWRDVMRDLARAGFRCFAPDMPGYGRTRLETSADRSLSGAAETVDAWMAASGMTRAWIVGHDLGGGVAQILAVRHPERVGRLTIGDAAVTDLWPVWPIYVFQAMARMRLYSTMAGLGLVEHNPYTWWAFRLAFAHPERISSLDAKRVFFDTKVSDPRGREEFAAHLRALTNRDTVDAAKHLHDVRVPTLLLWAARDHFQPWERTGERLRSLLSAPAIRVVPDAGHFLPLERPAEYARALLDWRRAT